MSNEPITPREARERGMNLKLVRNGDHPFHGVWTAEPPQNLRERSLALLAAASDEVWFSHATAAGLYGMWLPPRLRILDRLDVTTPAPRRALRGRGVRGRQRWIPQEFVIMQDGLPITTPAQTFVDLADILDVENLVAAGDGLLSRFAPLCTRDDIVDAVDRHRGRRGHRRLVEALPQLVDRSRSRPESLYRLAFLAEGLPEPKLNVRFRVNDIRVAAPDMAWWEARLAVEHEGDQHRTDRQQWQYDLGRYSDMADAGWGVRRVSVTTRAARRAEARMIAKAVRERWDEHRQPLEILPDPPASFPEMPD